MRATRFLLQRLRPQCRIRRCGTRPTSNQLPHHRGVLPYWQFRHVHTERPADSTTLSSSSPYPKRRPGESDGIEPMYDLDDEGNPILPDMSGDKPDGEKTKGTKIDAYELFRRRYYTGRSFVQAWETVYGYGDARAWEITADGGVLEQALTITEASYTLPETVRNVLVPGCGVGHADLRVLVHQYPQADLIAMDISQGAIMLLSEHMMSLYQKNRSKIPKPKPEEEPPSGAAAPETETDSSTSTSFEKDETNDQAPPAAPEPEPRLNPSLPPPLSTTCALVVGDFFSDEEWDSYYNYPEDAEVYEGEEEWEKEQMEMEKEREKVEAEVEEKYPNIEYADDRPDEQPLPSHLMMKNNITTKHGTEEETKDSDGESNATSGGDVDAAENPTSLNNDTSALENGSAISDPNEQPILQDGDTDYRAGDNIQEDEPNEDTFKNLLNSHEAHKNNAKNKSDEELSDQQVGFDLIYDRNFFTYIPPRRRPEWGQRIGELLNPDRGRLITLIDTRPPASKKGPPYPAALDDYREVLEKWKLEMDGEVVSYDDRYQYCVWKKTPQPESDRPKPADDPGDEEEELEWK